MSYDLPGMVRSEVWRPAKCYAQLLAWTKWLWNSWWKNGGRCSTTLGASSGKSSIYSGFSIVTIEYQRVKDLELDITTIYFRWRDQVTHERCWFDVVRFFWVAWFCKFFRGVVGTAIWCTFQFSAFQSASACYQGRECTNCTLPFRSVNSGMVHEVQEVSSGGPKDVGHLPIWRFPRKTGPPMDTTFFIQIWPNFSFSPMVTWGFTISGNPHSMDKAKRNSTTCTLKTESGSKTVGGRNPAPAWMVETLQIIG